MKNPRITPKERGLLKGAIRRVFSRSELRRNAIDKTRIEHKDVNRPRVTKWSRCPNCEKPTPTYLMEVDHVDPVIPLGKTLEDIDMNTLVDRVWCVEENLQGTCKECHKLKTKEERKLRTKKKGKKKS